MPENQIKVELIDYMGSDLSVVNAARVSFDKESDWVCESCGEPSGDDHYCYDLHLVLSEADTKLIKYLAKEKHISPFGHCFASFRVTAPIFVARQLVKHKFLRWNEVSRRYVDTEPEFYTPDTWRKRADNVKQGSSDEASGWTSNWHKRGSYEKYALAAYHDALGSGVCPEQARMVLPQSMMTSWWWSGSLDAFADMCRLRLDPHTQYESRLVAQQVSDEMAKLYPISWKELLR